MFFRQLFGVLLIAPQMFAAFTPTPHGARAIAMGGLTAVLSGDPCSAFCNPALAGGLRDIHVAIEYLPALFELPELSRGGVGVFFPIRGWALGGALTWFGGSLYRETEISLLTSIPCGDRQWVGLQVNTLHLSVAQYGVATRGTINAGGYFTVTPDIGCGFCASNLTGTTIREEIIPQVYSAGIVARPLPGLTVGLEVAKEVAFPLEIRYGAEYAPVNMLSLRGGISQQPAEYDAGFGLSLTGFSLDYAVTIHPVLGVTHVLSCTLQLGSQ